MAENFMGEALDQVSEEMRVTWIRLLGTGPARGQEGHPTPQESPLWMRHQMASASSRSEAWGHGGAYGEDSPRLYNRLARTRNAHIYSHVCRSNDATHMATYVNINVGVVIRG